MTASSRVSAALGCTCQKPEAATWKENFPAFSRTRGGPIRSFPSASTLTLFAARTTLSDSAPSASSFN